MLHLLFSVQDNLRRRGLKEDLRVFDSTFCTAFGATTMAQQ